MQAKIMEKITTIHASKQPRRPHHIEDWAIKRGMSQTDVAVELGADKSVVSRWFNGTSPGLPWQIKLAALFECEPESLFRHPDDDWMSRFLRGRSTDEVNRIKATLQTAFPKAANE
jgi:transcriptional regulator with XRE-family HTH domain